MKNQKLQSEYSKTGGYIQLCLPIETEVFIPVDNSVRLLDQVLEELDYRALYRSYSPEGRNPAVSPKRLFKIMVYAYSQGIYSSRKIEEACNLNLAFRYLLQGEHAPDHNTISRFRTKHLLCCAEDLLSQLVEHLADLGEIPFEHLFIDGTKIEANANRYTFVWSGAVSKNKEKLLVKAKALLERLFPDINYPEAIGLEHLGFAIDQLSKHMEKARIQRVSGRGKHKSQIQRDLEQLQDFHDRLAKYGAFEKIFRGRKSFSKTDQDATFMRLKDDDMKNGQLKPAYNIQLAVESEYMIGTHVSHHPSDMYTLKPFLKELEKNYQRKFKSLVCDAGYESEENDLYLDEQGIKSFIKPSNYEYSKTRKFQREMAFRQALQYDSEKDEYCCVQGRQLRFSGLRQYKRPSGFVSHVRRYTCESCEACPHLGTCYKGKYAKTIEVNSRFDQYREESRRNITTELGIQLRVNRSIQAEGAFAELKWNQSFTRFLTRGQVRVKTEMLLLALAHNINKLHQRIRNKRFGQALFPLQEAI